MEILHKEEDSKGVFYYEVNNERQAVMTYSRSGVDKFIIDHTEVDASLKGQGVGYAMVEKAVEYARANNQKILPLCPFAQAVFKKKYDTYKDVLA